MLAGSSQLDTYLDTGSGALLAQGQILRIRRRDGITDALLRDLASDTTILERASDGYLPEGGTDRHSPCGPSPTANGVGTVRTVMARRRRFVLLARRDGDRGSRSSTHPTSPPTATCRRGTGTCEVVALRARPVDPVFLDPPGAAAGELRPHALEAWQRGIGRTAREAIAG